MRVALALLVGLLVGCASPPSAPTEAAVHLVLADVLRGEPVVLTYGRHWSSAVALGGGTRTMEGDSGLVPRWANAVSAFVDANKNGQFDVLVEPGDHCESVGGAWQCDVRASMLTVHRVVSARIVGTTVDFVGDDLTVAVEDYDKGGRRRPDLSICMPGSAACATNVRHPFAPATDHIVAVTPCAVKATARTAGSPVAVEVRHGDGVRAVSLPEPVDLAPVLSVRQTSSEVIIDAVMPIGWSHALAWIGSTDAREVSWNTEADPGALVGRRQSFTVTIPLDRLRSCGNCKAMLQVVRVDDTDGLRSIAEARFVVDAGRP